jgi:hypothetical protein
MRMFPFQVYPNLFDKEYKNGLVSIEHGSTITRVMWVIPRLGQGSKPLL